MGPPAYQSRPTICRGPAATDSATVGPSHVHGRACKIWISAPVQMVDKSFRTAGLADDSRSAAPRGATSCAFQIGLHVGHCTPCKGGGGWGGVSRLWGACTSPTAGQFVDYVAHVPMWLRILCVSDGVYPGVSMSPREQASARTGGRTFGGRVARKEGDWTLRDTPGHECVRVGTHACPCW